MRQIKNFGRLIAQKGFRQASILYCKIVFIKVINLIYHRKLKEDWTLLKGKYRGKRVFLIGNGPSLNETPLYLLDKEYTMCFNRFNVLAERLNWHPNFYMMIDGLVAKDIQDEINKITPKVEMAFFPVFNMPEAFYFKKFIKKRDNVYWFLDKGKLENAFDLPYNSSGGTVAIAGMQILKYLGFSEIYLLGLDMNYKVHTTAKTIKQKNIQSQHDDDPNHFDPRYFGKGKKYHQPDGETLQYIMNSLKIMSEKFAGTETTIINTTFGGEVEFFPRKSLLEVLDYDNKYIEKKFVNLLLSKTSLNVDFRELAKLEPIEDLPDKYRNEDFLVVWSKDVTKFNNLLAFSHIPFGPYRSKSFFIKRNFVRCLN